MDSDYNGNDDGDEVNIVMQLRSYTLYQVVPWHLSLFHSCPIPQIHS